VEFGVDPPYGFAGANLDFFPLGSVARRTGFVHIRRATGDVPVYKVALRGFMRQLVSSHANLIWSIEGGRSRTGKLRPPRFGLLRYVVDAVTELESAEVQLVPVSILYDQLPTHEVATMTSEALGQDKRVEAVPEPVHGQQRVHGVQPAHVVAAQPIGGTRAHHGQQAQRGEVVGVHPRRHARGQPQQDPLLQHRRQPAEVPAGVLEMSGRSHGANLGRRLRAVA
jgi:hypothetical protein